MRVLGIDPGLRLTGYALVDASRDKMSLVEAGVFRVTKGAGNTALSVSARLEELDSDFRAALKRLQPDKIAIESIFAHHKHPATAIVMGHARGVLLLAVQQAAIDLVELKPTAVKKSITGNGHADKSQMQRAVQAYFGLAEPPEPPDVADAIAIAMCASQRHGAVV
ncbi:MAG: crossover junction endodeoxyribonuclease RuvC [Planctomycetota bacterium]